MFHILWYLIIGLLAGLISKSVMHVHLPLIWTFILASLDRSSVAEFPHHFSLENERYHPAGLIFSTLGAILILFHLRQAESIFRTLISRSDRLELDATAPVLRNSIAQQKSD